MVLAVVTAVLTGIIWYRISVYGSCGYTGLNLLLITIAPLVVPVTLMIFFWELNIPRNISFVKLIQYFVLGGILSLICTTLLHDSYGKINVFGAVVAPLFEEPAKLLISLFFLCLLKRDGKIFGINGLVIGAAVGAGFAAFESMQYAYNTVIVLAFKMRAFNLVMNNIITRSIGAFGSHIFYCAPYACAMAIAMSKQINSNKDVNILSVLKDKLVIITFIVSCFAHGLWNSGLISLCIDSFGLTGLLLTIISKAIFIIPLWWLCLKVLRISYAQLVDKIKQTSSTSNYTKQSTKIIVQCLNGTHAGPAFSIVNNEITVGTDASCKLTFPLSCSKIDKFHCKFVCQNGGIYLADLGSHYGTYLNGKKIKVGTGHLLKSGDVFCIGSEEEKFVVR